MHTFHFDDQYHTHFSYGYSIAPGGQEIVGDQEAFLNKKGGALVPYACTLPLRSCYAVTISLKWYYPSHADSLERTQSHSHLRVG